MSEWRCWFFGHREYQNARWVMQLDGHPFAAILELWTFKVCDRCGRRRFARDSGQRWEVDVRTKAIEDARKAIDRKYDQLIAQSRQTAAEARAIADGTWRH